MALLPAVGERTLSVRVRLAITLAYTLVVYPAVRESLSFGPFSVAPFLSAMATEVVAGLALGFGLRAFVFGLQMAGSMVAQSTSLSQVFGGAAVDPQPAMGHLLLIAGLALAVTYGLHVRIAEYLIFSFEIITPNRLMAAGGWSEWSLALVSKAFGLAFSISAPFVLASLIYNIALGAINKAMPQLMVSFVGAPAITAGGLLLLFVCAPVMLSVWQSAINGFFAAPFKVPG